MYEMNFFGDNHKTWYTVKPVLRGHIWEKEKKCPYKTGDLLKEVTTWAGLTVLV
jgi:hypothetical protein